MRKIAILAVLIGLTLNVSAQRFAHRALQRQEHELGATDQALRVGGLRLAVNSKIALPDGTYGPVYSALKFNNNTKDPGRFYVRTSDDSSYAKDCRAVKVARNHLSGLQIQCRFETGGFVPIQTVYW